MAKSKTNSKLSDSPEIEELTKITIRGGKEHNLKNIDLDIPRDKFVVITGLSGSGKSSLAFDTLYAEGQRRYVECLSAYARQFLGMLKKPDVDSIEGLSPAISIEQKSISHNPRSTVGTVTEIYDYLRLLFAKVGVQHCTECHVPVLKKSLDKICDDIISEYSGQKIQILAPLIKGRKGHYSDLFEQLIKQGFTRVRIDGEITPLKDGMQVSRYKVHDIELVVDRCIAEDSQSHRINESCSLALNRSDGTLYLLTETDGFDQPKMFSTNYTCPSCSKAYQPLAPNMFSFNSPYGCCKRCDGIGEIQDFEKDLIIPDKTKSIAEGAIVPLEGDMSGWLAKHIIAFAEKNNIDLNKPVNELADSDINRLLYGADGEIVQQEYKFGSKTSVAYSQKFVGLVPGMMHKYSSSSSAPEKRELEKYMRHKTCPVCHGGRLKLDNMAVLIQNKNIAELTNLDISNSVLFFKELPSKLSERDMKIVHLLLKEISSRLSFLENVGLSYLSLNRSVRSLSGGESQRIRLASQIGSQLVGIMYVLDEPSIGLHQHDNNKLIDSLKELRDLGNTVIVVEHDKAMIEQADYLVDMGPGAGVHGGEVVLAADRKTLANLKEKDIENSLTAQYLKNIKRIEIPEKRREPNGKYLVLAGANGNNLNNVTLSIPLGLNVCITGMSGSGKSSLINDTLYPILSKYFFRGVSEPLEYKSIEGLELIDKVIEIDQTPIGRTPRSNPATYTGIFTLVRDFFAMLPEAKIRGYKPGRFSFNVKSGRCEECEGAGLKKLEMNFLPDVYVQCDVCEGKRYNRETLEVKYKNKSIADVLDLTVEEALDFFSEIPKLKRKFQTLLDVGLSYIKLGQQAPTLSGGEAQRVKLATELSKISTGKTLYLLDEPTTGLHFEDIRILMKLLDKLVEKGNTVVTIEHNLDVIKCADWVIDLGPSGGMGGGYIISEGAPEKIVKQKKGFTWKYLKEELDLLKNKP